MTSTPSAGDAIATNSRVIEVRVAELTGPWPCASTSNVPPGAPRNPRCLARRFTSISKLVRLGHDEHSGSYSVEVASACSSRSRSSACRWRSAISSGISDGGFAALLQEGLLIGGWVAMWRPLEVFLYDWWPILGEVRLLDRLSQMPVRIEYKERVSDDAWRSDWPAVPTSRLAGSQQRTQTDSRSVRRPAMPLESAEHQHTPEEERKIREAALDQTIEASFPASDPPSSDPNPDDHAALECQQGRGTLDKETPVRR